MTQKKFVIIDGNAIVHRASHALPPMTVKGAMVNAVYGFTSMLLKVLKDLQPDYLAVTFDVAGGTFRHKKYKEYKATRVKADQSLYDQMPLVHQIVEAFGVPIYEKQNYEADDVIGTVVTNLQSSIFSLHSIIVTGDMDTMQLVNEKTSVYGLRKGMSDIAMYNPEEVKKKYGFGPEFVVDYKALRGDASDNIPGVPGIGEKTAVELITKVGDLEKIYKIISHLPSPISKDIKSSVIEKLKKGKESAFMSKDLATLDCNVPDLDFDLEKCDVKKFDKAKLSEMLKKFEFWSLVKRVNGDDESYKVHKVIKFIKSVSEVMVVDKNNIDEFEKIIKDANEFACKEMVDGNVLDGVVKGLYKLYNFTNFINLFDTMLASYLIDSSTRAHDLRSIVQRDLGETLPDSSQGGLFGIDPKTVAQELSYIMQIKKKQEKKLEKMSDAGLFEKIEMKLIPVLAEMELNGIAIDSNVLNKLSKEVNTEIERLTKKICKEAKFDFNPASSQQLRDVLFDKLQLPTQGIKKGKTGYSTADAELEKLAGLHPIIDLMRDYRELAKLQNTYVDVLPTLVNKNTGRIHTTFNQAVTTTGRLSSSEPNLQNIPIRTDLGKQIRNAFVAEEGNQLVVADYSQIELRIVASLARDERMIEIFEKGEDIHKATAAVINGVDLKDVTKEMRSAAKAVNFGVLYGMGSYGLSGRTGLTRSEAQDFIKKYFQEFAGVKKYLDQTIEFVKKEGYVETLFGRRRYIPELQSDNFMLRSAGERMAINMPIQGTAADVMKLAMIEVHNKLQITNYKLQIRLILQVHDELVLEVKKGLGDEVAKMVKEVMENVVKLRVPIDVQVGVGRRWGEIKRLGKKEACPEPEA